MMPRKTNSHLDMGSKILKIGLISCGKNKLPYSAPARELYTGDLFKKASAYAEQHYDRWYILSAKYGVLHPDTVIEPYDKTLNKMGKGDREIWVNSVIRTLQTMDIGLTHEYYIHAGKRYQEICKYLPKCNVPLKSLGIGEQLAWYKKEG